MRRGRRFSAVNSSTIVCMLQDGRCCRRRRMQNAGLDDGDGGFVLRVEPVQAPETQLLDLSIASSSNNRSSLPQDGIISGGLINSSCERQIAGVVASGKGTLLGKRHAPPLKKSDWTPTSWQAPVQRRRHDFEVFENHLVDTKKQTALLKGVIITIRCYPILVDAFECGVRSSFPEHET